MDSICLNPGITFSTTCHVTSSMHVTNIKRIGKWGFSLNHPLVSFWQGGKRRNAVVVEERETEAEVERDDGNWVSKIMHLRSAWRGRERDEAKEEREDDEFCRVDDFNDDDENERVVFDRSSFSKMLRRVSLGEARVYARMSYLGNLAYCIPDIKPKNLLKIHGLRFITSSSEKKEIATKAEKEKLPEQDEIKEELSTENEKKQEEEIKGSILSPSGAYHIAASAASYIHTKTKSIISFTSSKSDAGQGSFEECYGNGKLTDDEIASLMAKSTDVVAAKEEVKQAVADNLNSTSSSPCEWYICDDDLSGTRYFVIQGSETLASWQANLLFEPVQFEGLAVPVHRGIYEAAKGIYEQVLPEIHSHLKSNGDHATFRFTGHSLGGSLSLLINLMLLKRGEVPPSSLLPVITFGAPTIMCGGDRLLHELGLPRHHVQSITMHRDIVPRAFSCNYPSHVAELLKVLNGNFRNHPCLNNRKLLYAPMGELLILQPDEKHSPNHDLLPPGSGLYLLNCPSLRTYEAERQLRAAKSVFLNSPHPLEILRDRSAYGSDGTVQRDHDMNSYLKSVRSVIRQELSQIRSAKKEQRSKNWWPFIMSRTFDEGVIGNSPESRFHFLGILQTGTRSLKRFSRLVASQNVNMLVVLLVPARLLVLGTFGVIKLVY